MPLFELLRLLGVVLLHLLPLRGRVVFLVGLLLGIVYLEKWSSARQTDMESDLLEEAEA